MEKIPQLELYLLMLFHLTITQLSILEIKKLEKGQSTKKFQFPMDQQSLEKLSPFMITSLLKIKKLVMLN